MTKPHVYPEYLALVPRHDPQSRENLKQSLIDKGLQVDIEVSSQTGRIVDGMTRFDLCDELKIKKTYKWKDFDSVADEMEYVITANLKRRQLTIFQQIVLAQSLRKQFMLENQSKKSSHISNVKKGVEEPTPLQVRLKTNTRARIAHLVNCGTAVVDQAHYILDHGTQEEIDLVMSNKIAINRMYLKIVNRRRKIPGILTRGNRVFPQCKKCGADTRFRGKCHVHSDYCCTKCDWGV